MWIYDVETLDFLEVNEAALNYYGYSQEEFLSMNLRDVHPESEITKLLLDIETTDTQISQTYDWIHKKKDGELIPVEVASYPIIFNQRNARHVLINAIAERKKVEE